MRRVYPTGKCWCGCGEATERTSFFIPGHDKRAEAKVVKEVYGSVVELLVAHGYGPEGRDPKAIVPVEIDAMGLQLLEAWSGPREDYREHVVLEFLNAENRGGPLCRAASFHVAYLAKDRTARFELCSTAKVQGCDLMIPPSSRLTVPFLDIAWVYTERDLDNNSTRVARVRGAIVADPVRFVPFG